MLKAIHAEEDRRSAEDKVREFVVKLQKMRLPKAAELHATGLMPYLCAMCDRFCAR